MSKVYKNIEWKKNGHGGKGDKVSSRLSSLASPRRSANHFPCGSVYYINVLCDLSGHLSGMTWPEFLIYIYTHIYICRRVHVWKIRCTLCHL